MKNLISYDGYLMQVLTKLMYIISANILFIICSIPIVTIGASAAAMYTLLFEYKKGNEPQILPVFFQAFRRNFKAASMSWLIWLVFCSTLVINVRLIHAQGGSHGFIEAVLNILFIFAIAVLVYIIPAIGYYENSIYGYFQFSARMVLAHLPKTIAIVLLAVSPAILLFMITLYSPVFVPMLFLAGFSAGAYLSSGLLMDLFRMYEDSSDEMETLKG